MLSAGEAEFVNDFGTPFSLKSLWAVHGWPEHQWECRGGWAHDSPLEAFDRVPGAGKALASLLSAPVKANLILHRVLPNNDDATNALLAMKVDERPLEDDQIVTILRNWIAGHGTVVAGLSIVVLHLAQKTELQSRLRSDPSLIPAAIEEIMRVDGPLVANTRTSTREVEIRGADNSERRAPEADVDSRQPRSTCLRGF